MWDHLSWSYSIPLQKNALGPEPSYFFWPIIWLEHDCLNKQIHFCGTNMWLFWVSLVNSQIDNIGCMKSPGSLFTMLQSCLWSASSGKFASFQSWSARCKIKETWALLSGLKSLRTICVCISWWLIGKNRPWVMRDVSDMILMPRSATSSEMFSMHNLSWSRVK